MKTPGMACAVLWLVCVMTGCGGNEDVVVSNLMGVGGSGDSGAGAIEVSATPSAGAGVCSPGDTRTCVGAAACRGGQSCDAGVWSACDCGQASDGDSNGSARMGTGSVAGGGDSGADGSGDGVVLMGGTGGSASAGVAGGVGGATAGTGGKPAGSSGSGGIVGAAGSAGAAPCKKAWYRDGDGDGFGDPHVEVTACLAPAGYVDNRDDCYDQNRSAKPRPKSEPFQQGTDRGDGSFDWDCSGAEDAAYPEYAECPPFDNTCPPPNFWKAGFSCDYLGMVSTWKTQTGWTPGFPIPKCGKGGYWGVSVLWNGSSFECSIASTSSRLQGCR